MTRHHTFLPELSSPRNWNFISSFN